jgi:hypothetical protein
MDAIRPTARRLLVLRSGGSAGKVADWEALFSACQNLASRTLIERSNASNADTAAVESSVVASAGMFTSLQLGFAVRPIIDRRVVPGARLSQLAWKGRTRPAVK